MVEGKDKVADLKSAGSRFSAGGRDNNLKSCKDMETNSLSIAQQLSDSKQRKKMY